MNTGARPPSPEDDLKHLSPDALIARILELQSQNLMRVADFALGDLL
jgi:transposase